MRDFNAVMNDLEQAEQDARERAVRDLLARRAKPPVPQKRSLLTSVRAWWHRANAPVDGKLKASRYMEDEAFYCHEFRDGVRYGLRHRIPRDRIPGDLYRITRDGGSAERSRALDAFLGTTGRHRIEFRSIAWFDAEDVWTPQIDTVAF